MNRLLLSLAMFSIMGMSAITNAQDVIIVDDHSTGVKKKTSVDLVDPEHHVPIANDRARPVNLEYQLMTLEQRKRSQRHPIISMLAGAGFFLIAAPMLLHGLIDDPTLAVAGLVPLGLSAVFFVIGGLFFRRNKQHNKALEAERQRLLHGFSPSGFSLRF